MTVSTSVGREHPVLEIITSALRSVALLEMEQQPSLPQQQQGMLFLDEILAELSIYGVQARALQFYTTSALTVGATYIDLPATIQDVVGDAMYLDAGTDPLAPDNGSPVRNILSDQWQRRQNQVLLGEPTEFYVDRSAGIVRVFLWPQPNEAGLMRFRAERLLADCDSTTVTLDLEPYWQRWVRKTLASEFAGTAGLRGVQGEIELMLAQKEKLVTGRSKPKTERGFQMRMYHPTPWGRGRY